MEKCIENLKETFNELLKVLTILIKYISNRNPNSKDLSTLENYQKNVRKFYQYCESLNTISFQRDIKGIYQTAGKLINYFSNNIIDIIESNDATSLSKYMSNLPRKMQSLLIAMKDYISEENSKMINTQKRIIQKRKQYLMQRGIQQENLIPISEGGFIGGLFGGFTRTFVSAFKMITFKEQNINNEIDRANNHLDALNKRLDNTLGRVDSEASGSSNWQHIKGYFTSSEFGATVGGIVGIVLIFIMIRKALSGIIRFIKNKWNDFWEWAKS